jgi:hypothetical protein
MAELEVVARCLSRLSSRGHPYGVRLSQMDERMGTSLLEFNRQLLTIQKAVLVNHEATRVALARLKAKPRFRLFN